MPSFRDLENNETHLEDCNRFQLGKKHGAEDQNDDVDSDVQWFKKSGFWEKDQPYCTGYQLGYIQGKGKKK